MSDIGERVKKIVVEHLGVEPDKVIEGASFIDDLGADSLDTVELVMAFEEEFGCEIPDDAAETILTVGDAVKFPFPAIDGPASSSREIAHAIGQRMLNLYLPNPETGRRPCYGDTDKFQSDPFWREYLLFFEHFHGDNGAGLGAMHQTGWTGLIANLVDEKYRT